ncbi:MAG: hypothetical protein VB064_06015 [Oscillospiraceae bacterium]|nr:hypothetical protein [Oscillospiraceae bacterium]
MSYSVQSIGADSNGILSQQALQEHMLLIQQLREGKVQEDGTKVEDSAAVTSTSAKSDTVEISAEGQLALAQIKAGVSFSSQQTEAESTDEVVMVSSSKSLHTSELENDETISGSDLYSLSESELKSLVSEGKITRKQMEEELLRRSGDA